MQPMTKEECLEFLQAGTRTGKLSTVKAAGLPHCVPIWFVIDDGDLVFMTMSTSVKAKNLRRQPQVMVCVDEQSFPYDFVTVVGTAEIHDLSEAELLPYSKRIALRYVGEDRADATAQRNADPEEVLIRVKIERFISAKDVAA